MTRTGRMHRPVKQVKVKHCLNGSNDKSQLVKATELMPEGGTEQVEDDLALSEESDFEGFTGLLAATFM